jgi:sortase B
LIIVLLCVFTVSGYSLSSYAYEYYELNKSYENAQDLVQIGTLPEESIEAAEEIDTAVPFDEYKNLKIDINIDWNALLLKSHNIVGWIYIPNSNINYPLVRKDNEYYLNHDYSGKWNPGGSIFLDEAVNLNSKNVVIYGHHMKMNIMFHSLPYYADQKYADAHQYIYIATENETRIYQVFSVVYTDHESDTYTWDFGVGSEITFNDYINDALANSLIDTDIKEITEDDVLISLSTCTGRASTERLVVHAVLLTTY